MFIKVNVITTDNDEYAPEQYIINTDQITKICTKPIHISSRSAVRGQSFYCHLVVMSNKSIRIDKNSYEILLSNLGIWRY